MEKSKYETSLSNTTNLLHESIYENLVKKLISIKSVNMLEDQIQEILDYSIELHGQNMPLDKFYKIVKYKDVNEMIQSYYIYRCLQLDELLLNSIIDCDITDIFEDKFASYYRITNNDYLLLYTVMNNLDICKKFCHDNVIDIDENGVNLDYVDPNMIYLDNTYRREKSSHYNRIVGSKENEIDDNDDNLIGGGDDKVEKKIMTTITAMMMTMMTMMKVTHTHM